MKCQICGKENNDDALFCSSCGSKLKTGKGNNRGVLMIAAAVTVVLLLALGSLLYFIVSAVKGSENDNNADPEPTEYTTAPEADELSEITQGGNSKNKATIEKIEDDTSEYVLPDSDKRYLSRSELTSLTNDELRVARNEIFARHGRRFNDAALQSHFDSCSWYMGTVAPEKFNESVFNEYEKANKDLIVSVESERK